MRAGIQYEGGCKRQDGVADSRVREANQSLVHAKNARKDANDKRVDANDTRVDANNGVREAI